MTRPVQVTFRRMQPFGGVEEDIRARAAWLDTFYPSIIGCRVLVEVPHRHRGHGRPVRIRIELALPGEDVVVSHEPTLHGSLKDVEREAHHKDDEIDAVHKHALLAVHEAFDAARRRLEDFARRRRADVKTHGGHGRAGPRTLRIPAEPSGELRG